MAEIGVADGWAFTEVFKEVDPVSADIFTDVDECSSPSLQIPSQNTKIKVKLGLNSDR